MSLERINRSFKNLNIKKKDFKKIMESMKKELKSLIELKDKSKQNSASFYTFKVKNNVYETQGNINIGFFKDSGEIHISGDELCANRFENIINEIESFISEKVSKERKNVKNKVKKVIQFTADGDPKKGPDFDESKDQNGGVWSLDGDYYVSEPGTNILKKSSK